MDYVIGMEMDKSQRYVMAEVDLCVEGDGVSGPLQEGGEAFVHQLHEED